VSFASGSVIRRVAWVRGVCPVAAVVVGMLFAPAASVAAEGVAAFFPQTPPAGGTGGALNQPQGIGVYEATGDIYVAGGGTGATAASNRVDRFSADGEFEMAWGKDVVIAGRAEDTGTGFETCTVADDCKTGVPGFLGGELTIVQGLAVDQSDGSVYVMGRHSVSGGGSGGSVQKFTADGEFVWALGKDVVDGVGNPGAAGDSPGGNSELCTNPAQCKTATIGGLGGEFANPGSSFNGGSTVLASGGGGGVAVVPTDANAPLANAGNVLVTDPGNRRVQEFTSAGAFVRTFGFNVAGGGVDDSGTGFEVCSAAGSGAASCTTAAASGPGVGQFANNTPSRIAVDSSGVIYTVEHATNFRLQKFTPQPGAPGLAPAVVNPNIGGSGPALSLTGTAVTSNVIDVAVDTTSDHVFVLRRFAAGTGTPTTPAGERRVVELDSTGALVDTHIALAGLDSGHNNIARDSVRDITYLGGGTSLANSRIYVLGLSFAPTVSMAVGGVTSDTAELSGLVNPGGPDTAIGVRTRYHFEYRRLGDPAWTAVSADLDAGNGFDNVPVRAALSGLEANTAYEAKLVASKPFSGAASVETAAQLFVTAAARPDIEAVSAIERGASTVTLSARINPNNSATTYRFEYGLTAAYGSSAPIPDGNAGAGANSQVYTEALAGLAPQTTYHFRVVATNANGTTRSSDKTFTTLPAMHDSGARAFELVSPADKISGVGAGNWHNGIGALANVGVPAQEGDRFAVQANFGSVLLEGAYEYASGFALAERRDTASGWVSHSPITHAAPASQEYRFMRMREATPDLSKFTVKSNGGLLKMFPEQADWIETELGDPSYVGDWDGRWEIFGPTDPAQVPLIGQPSDRSLLFTAISADGSHVVGSGSSIKGLAGPTDPSLDQAPGAAGGGVVYVNDVSAGLSNDFPGAGVRSVANVCTDGTLIPRRLADGRLDSQGCELPPAGRSARLISQRGATIQLAPPLNKDEASSSQENVVSGDGSRVFFMTPDPNAVGVPASCSGTDQDTECAPQLYVRQKVGGKVVTRWISRADDALFGQQAATLTAMAVFEGATPDGDKVFFRTTSPLTVDDPNGLGQATPGGVKTGSPAPSSWDLYMYDLPDAPGADPGDGTLTRISAGPTGQGDCNSPLGGAGNSAALRFVSTDGQRAYFTCAAPLAGVSNNANGTITAQGGARTTSTEVNLYSYDATGPSWKFVARLPRATGPDMATCASTGADFRSAIGEFNSVSGRTTLSVDANCVRGTFDGSFITFFTNGRLTADDPDAVTGDVYAYDAETDELTRITATQGGPGGAYACATDFALHPIGFCNGDGGINQEGEPNAPLGLVTDPAVKGDRVAFFQSRSRLVAKDTDDAYDVYQWRNGVLSLMSPGDSGTDGVFYKGNGRTGRNVYMATMDQLSWQDHDAVMDIYSARTGGGIPQPAVPVICEVLAAGCHGGGAAEVAAPQVVSSLSAGGGNAKARARAKLSVARPTAGARRRAARTGRLALRVRTSASGKVTVVARGRLARRTRVLGRGAKRVARPGTVTVSLRLNAVARRALHRGRRVTLAIEVRQAGVRRRSITVALKRGDRS
jgi:hypothetical protein